MFILLGVFFGLLAAVPLGPVNFFVVSQALKRDFLHGLMAGLTAAFLDVTFCFVAMAGFFKIKLNLPPYSMSVLKAVAAVILLLLARKLIRDSRTYEIPQDNDRIPSASPKPILGVILLYVTNPTLYMYWIFVAGAVTGHNLLGQNLVRYGTWTAVGFAVTRRPDLARLVLRTRPLRLPPPAPHPAGDVPQDPLLSWVWPSSASPSTPWEASSSSRP